MNIEQIDNSIDLTQSILWQYNNATNINGLINDKQAWYDTNQTGFWEDWYTHVFNLITANNFGLIVWCIILNLPFLVLIEPVTKPIWGFNINPSENSNVNFTRGTFAPGTSSRIILTTEEQRLFLRLRYFQLVSYGDIIFTNNFLDLLFNDPDGLYVGGAWVLDNFDMTMTYVFNCPISNPLLQALEQYDVLPRPAGVSLMYEVL